ncbi:MAG: VOC family protein [Thermomicrobiales bacterium]
MATVLRLQHTSIPMPAGGEAAARAFFGGALGMTEVAPPPELHMLRIIWFKAGMDGHEIHLFTDDAMARNSSAQHICLEVDDFATFREKLSAADIEIEETIAIPSRPRCFVHDPFGNLIELMQITGDHTAA